MIVSEALRGNPLGDPHERPLWVYTPPGYAGGPTVYVLQGYTGSSRCGGTAPRSARPSSSCSTGRTSTRGSSSSTRSRRSAARSSSTRTAAAATTPTSATRSSRSSTRATTRTASAASPASRAAATARSSPRCCGPTSSRLRQPRRRRPLRGLDPAVLPARGAAAARRVRRLDRALPGRAPHRPGAARAPARPPHPAPVGLLGRLLGGPGRHDPASRTTRRRRR